MHIFQAEFTSYTGPLCLKKTSHLFLKFQLVDPSTGCLIINGQKAFHPTPAGRENYGQIASDCAFLSLKSMWC